MATFFDFRPAKNFIGIVPHTDIYFAVEDSQGIDISTLTIYIDQVLAVYNGIFQTGFSGAFTQSTPAQILYFININPLDNFLFGENVTVGITIKNKLHVQFSEFYSFDIILNPDHTLPETIPIPRGNRFNHPITVSLNVFDASVTQTYYTFGSDPLIHGILYTGPISISNEATTTLKYYSRNVGNADPSMDLVEPVKTEIYILDFTAPVTTPSVRTGMYLTQQFVSLSVNEPAITYLTVDGTDPVVSSSRQVYSSPVLISNEGTTTLKFYSVDYANNIESTQTEIFTISYAKSNFLVTNGMVTSPYVRGVLDIIWDDMQHYDSTIMGYNVYRSYFYNGPYTRLNDALITTTTYRDIVSDLEIIEEDVSQQFQQTVQINRFASDNFEGNTIDPIKWIEHDYENFLLQSDGLLFEDLIGREEESCLTSRFKFTGDFDFSLVLDLIHWSIPNAEYCFAGAKLHHKNGNGLLFVRQRGQFEDVLLSATITNSLMDTPITTSNGQTIITLRVTRTSGTITTSYIDSTNNAIIHHSFVDYDTTPLYVSLIFGSADVQVSMKLNQFIVHSGNAVIIQPFNPQNEYVIKVARTPIVDSITGPTGNTKFVDLFESAITNRNIFVKVTVDGVEAKIKSVFGLEGEIVLDDERYYDYINKRYVEPVLPNEDSVVKVTYYTRRHDVDYSLRKPLYYKITAQNSCGETDLSLIKPITLQAESLDYIYAEALRRNQWLLDQAGESVLLFVKARAGVRCQCYIDNERTHRQPKNKCTICYGVGFIPSYAAPMAIKISPAMAEQKLLQTDRGIRLDYQTEVWAIVPVILNQRDFLVRRDGTILGIGAQTAPEVRGRRLDQQHFTIQPVDRSDVRYDYLDSLNLFDNRYQYGLKNEGLVTGTKNNQGTCPSQAVKGRTLAFENIEF